MRRVLFALCLPLVAVFAAQDARAGDFDREAATSALQSVDVQQCKPKGKKAKASPVGEGHVIVTYAPNGEAQTATLDRGPFLGTKMANCIEGKFKKTKVPPFDGNAISVGKNFIVN